MSLVSMPFVDSGVDTALHIVAAVVLVGSIAAVVYGFWRIHELPIQKAHTKEHHQIGLITALTWIGFIWHWVWVVAVIIAFVDGEKALCRIRDIWKANDHKEQDRSSISTAEAVVADKQPVVSQRESEVENA
ncbi:MFS transporter [Photobacterium sanctipauli]|uniref:MFS transporter n=1 Tax=Photobacterium sanctipauli TaxID=1342794 RepID=A0A2T3NWP4_9GAMM|nr:MFS transporter [Photobacterium sanctipauli]PSW20713.1 MFS transporter [Photobacterium sanctipauli]